MAVSGGNVVVVMDELNRTTPYVANGLMGLLDHRRAVLIEEIGEVIRVGPGTLFVGTINEGGAYTGTHGMDLASRGRFGLRMECDYLTEQQEIDVLVKKAGIKRNQATRLVEFAHAVRHKASSMDGAGLTGTVSTRQLLTAAEYLARGGTATLEFTVVNHFDGTGGPQSERAQVVAMLEGKFPELKGKPAEAEEPAVPGEEVAAI
jgi:MoxR-like ATPase